MIKPGLRLVSLNTNLYYSPNEVTVNMSDPAGQFQWLQETLELSRQNMEKVSIFRMLLQDSLILERARCTDHKRPFRYKAVN